MGGGQHLTAGLDSTGTTIWLRGRNGEGIGIYADRKAAGSLQPSKIGTITKIKPQSLLPSRRGESSLSPSLIQQWLKDCEINHAMMCRLESDQKSSSLILIEVVDNCLVAVPVETIRRYFALSYVWGGIKMLQITMANLELLKRPGALLDHTVYIPSLIRDAISLVPSLDEWYLWVVSLCIVQDDTAVKHL
jgi:hypothetical protein